MVCGQIDVNGAEEIAGTHEIVLLVPRQIAQIDHLEGAERQHHANRTRVFRRVLFERFVISTQRIGGGCAGQRPLDQTATGRDDPDIDIFEGHRVAGFDKQVAPTVSRRGVSRKECGRTSVRLDGRSVVDKVPHRQPL